ncbi:diguanylate cyclase (GGDEF) domain-containing protein [Sphaerochaeta pleomorpha str. Grapes]|uniref:diguanylate cyclase n=1 Tax=Sphaerochaeta pleomorpha (strain ATCC BAA-1885 / DSM 22778 / Grapes) TaxID=158190 RepID=G8QSB4_SPHPG|nr:GGDEF domain-containing protein [Sphaerochaeta pleomorpha]AEV30044.1 diguanylate cyclase (GGDEF) domain-containing protein [Sphaerochaeta pleomorpha str. Grapes]
MPIKKPEPTQRSFQMVIIGLVIIVFSICILFDSFLQTEPLQNEKNIAIDSGWTISVDGTIVAENITLPYSIKEDVKGKTSLATRTLPLEYPNNNTCFAIETGMCSLELLVEGQSLYRFDATGSPWKVPVYGGGFSHFVRLPNWTRGKEITLKMEFSSNNSFAGNIRIPELGSKASVLLEQQKEWPSLVFGYSFILLGLICFLVSLGLKKGKERDNLFYFGWIEIALGSWVFTQSCSKLFIIRNPAVPMNLSMAALYLLPFFLSKFVCISYFVGPWEKKLCNVSIIFPIGYVVGGILQILGLVQYTDMLLYAGLALGLYLLAFFMVSFIDYCKGNKALGSFLVAILILIISVGAEELLLFLGIILRNAVILHFGMTLSGVILFWHSARIIKEGSLSKFKEQMLLEMAYTDSLTGLNNRSAYEKRIQTIMDTKTNAEVIGVLLMDINNLKEINDTLGHLEGDRILKDFSHKIEKLAPSRSEIYRIGGDEFVCLITKTTEDHLQKLANEIENTKFANGSSVAVGYSIFIPKKKEKFSNIIHKADSSMYICKNRMKQASAIAIVQR